MSVVLSGWWWSLAGGPVTISIKVFPVAGVAFTDGCSSGFTSSGAVLVVHIRRGWFRVFDHDRR
jgi:hypothetical protein